MHCERTRCHYGVPNWHHVTGCLCRMTYRCLRNGPAQKITVELSIDSLTLGDEFTVQNPVNVEKKQWGYSWLHSWPTSPALILEIVGHSTVKTAVSLCYLWVVAIDPTLVTIIILCMEFEVHTEITNVVTKMRVTHVPMFKTQRHVTYWSTRATPRSCCARRTVSELFDHTS